MEIYLVGGAVRDALLNRPVSDRDWVVVGATPEEMEEAGYRPVGADFPVFLHPKTHEEYALARTERKQGHGYHGFVVHSAPDVSLEDDLRRRDLTINAMAQDMDGQIIDPFHGQKDLKHRLLRHVSPAFAEDPLRILRTARFAARFAPIGFRVAEETMALMTTMVESGEVDHLVPERAWQETQRALGEASPSTYFRVLQDCGALARLIPPLAAEMEKDAGSPLNRLERASELCDDIAIRFAALLAPVAPSTELHELTEALRAPNDVRDLARLAAAHLPLFNGTTPVDPGNVIHLFNEADAWRRPERFERLLVIGQAIQERATPSHAIRRIRKALDRAREVNPQALIKEGFQGAELGQAIQSRRQEAIRESLESD